MRERPLNSFQPNEKYIYLSLLKILALIDRILKEVGTKLRWHHRQTKYERKLYNNFEQNILMK